MCNFLNFSCPTILTLYKNSLKLPGVLFSISLIIYKNIEEWKVERRTLFLEEQEMLKATKTFFVQSNLLLNFCKDCHSAFLKGNAEQKRKIVKMVCSNFSYDGENLIITIKKAFQPLVEIAKLEKMGVRRLELLTLSL